MTEDTKKLEEIEKKYEILNNCIKRLLELSSNEDEEVRMRSLEALDSIRTPEVENRIRKGVNDPDELVRHSCLEILGLWKDKASIDLIKKALSDESWMARSEAAVALAEIGDKESISTIKEKIETADEEELVRYYFSLYKLGEHEYYSKFLNCMFHENYRIRFAAANLIPELTNPNNKQFILNLLSSVAKKEKSKAVLSSINEAIKELTR
jgi:HEAT repeat protein